MRYVGFGIGYVGCGVLILWSEAYILAAVHLIGGALMAWPLLCDAGRITALGGALRIDRAGLHLPGEPVVSWRSVKALKVVGHEPNAWFKSRDVDFEFGVELVLTAPLRQRPWSAWRWLFGPWTRRRADVSSLRVDGSLWRTSAIELQAALHEGAWRYGSPSLRGGLPVNPFLEEPAENGRGARNDRAEQDFDRAQAEAVRLILAGRKASDPELKAAWARVDAARARRAG